MNAYKLNRISNKLFIFYVELQKYKVELTEPPFIVDNCYLLILNFQFAPLIKTSFKIFAFRCSQGREREGDRKRAAQV